MNVLDLFCRGSNSSLVLSSIALGLWCQPKLRGVSQGSRWDEAADPQVMGITGRFSVLALDDVRKVWSNTSTQTHA